MAQDLYIHDGNNYLLTVDASSGYWEVDEMTQMTTEQRKTFASNWKFEPLHVNNKWQTNKQTILSN